MCSVFMYVLSFFWDRGNRSIAKSILRIIIYINFINIMKFRVVIFSFLFAFSCETQDPEEHISWKKKRYDELFTDDGYLNIAGLYPVQDGNYLMGSGESNDIKIPSDLPELLANVSLEDSLITFIFNLPVILNDTLEVESLSYNFYNIKNSFSLGSYVWFVHLDSGSKAIRIRNLKHPLLDTKLVIDFFPYSLDYVIQGRYEKYDTPKVLSFNNILGDSYLDTIPGIIHFNFGNKDFSFEPTISPSGKFFVAFEDLTSGKDTYGGGRYLYILPEDENSNVIIDFNKSLNPPCVFSIFTTCPVPRKENKLPIKISAGEKNYDGVLFSSVYQ
ncbi:MAG: hypothetical protein CMB94_00020 [Flammeovirgaceae bacterium]|nr:hypothetical protein [Flammeovirgaceae bacterium]